MAKRHVRPEAPQLVEKLTVRMSPARGRHQAIEGQYGSVHARIAQEDSSVEAIL